MKGCLFVCFALLGLGCDPQALLGRRLLSSCRVQAPEHTGLVVGTHTLSCPAACEILVPQPGMEPMSPALKGGFLTTGPPGKSLHYGLLQDTECSSLCYTVGPCCLSIL